MKSRDFERERCDLSKYGVSERWWVFVRAGAENRSRPPSPDPFLGTGFSLTLS
jgi:hypothetical protein